MQSGIGSADIAGPRDPCATAGAARRLACDYDIIPAVLGTQSDILDIGIPNRLATHQQRFNIALRDGGCLFPGCDRPRRRTATPTTAVHWIDGGPTAEYNLDSFCVFDHHQIHEGGWTYTIIDTETLTFHPPAGGPPHAPKRRPLLHQNLTTRLHPEPTVHPETPRRT